MPPLETALKLISLPFRAPGKLYQAAEMQFASFFHPEQILSKSPNLKRLYDFTVKEERLSKLAAEGFKSKARDIVTKYGIDDEAKANQFLELLEFPFYNKRPPTAIELARYPKPIARAVVEHLREIEDPIWTIAKRADPEIGYVAGHFTHFPIKALKANLEDEIRRLGKMVQGMQPGDAAKSTYEQHLKELTEKLAKISHEDASVNALRYNQLPSGGRFGPLDEVRRAQHLWGYKRNYQEVMEDYIDGAMRKVFLDRYMPSAKKLIDMEPNAALRQYAFDYVTAQRGALSAKRRLFTNEAFSKLFSDPEQGYRGVAKSVDYVTRFQYLTKIGLSWFRFPFVNATQPLLTTYPMVGGKVFLQAYDETLRGLANRGEGIWKLAKDTGVVFEATLRKGITEALGRGGKLSKAERALSWPAKVSEELNRVVTFSAGIKKAMAEGKDIKQAVEEGVKLVNRTQFLYSKAGLPTFMSSSPTARLIFQFRTFTANYVNYLTQLVRGKQYKELSRAMGALSVLAGTSAIPFNLWDHTRKGLLRNTGVDIGEFNPIEFATEQMGIAGGINLSGSFEPFNIPSDVYSLLGPTVGPVTKLGFDVMRKPEEMGKTFKDFTKRISPPITAYTRVGEKEARGEPTQKFPEGRVIGQRPFAEKLWMRPPLEGLRFKYIELMANAIVGGRQDLVNKYVNEARRKGLAIDQQDMAAAKARATKLMGVD